MPDTPMPEYGAVIALTPDNAIILQLRDNNPDIADPNCLSLFAGRLKPGEDPKTGALREFAEETTIKLQPDDLTFLLTYQTDVARYGLVKQSHVFIAKNIDPASVVVQEGQGYRIIQGREDLERYDFALISKDILEAYFDSLEK